MTTYNSPGFANKAPGYAHGEARGTNRLHEIIAVPATIAANDVINVAYLPANAVVSGLNLKAATQLDSGATPTLAIDIGTTVNPQLFSALSSVGRSAGSSVDTNLLPAGRLYRNTTGAKQLVVATVHTAAATPSAGTLEIEMSYFIEDAAGSPA